MLLFLGKWIKHGDWYPDRKLGLIQMESTLGCLNPHAKLSFTGDYKQKFLHGDLEHYSYDNIRLLAVNHCNIPTILFQIINLKVIHLTYMYLLS